MAPLIPVVAFPWNAEVLSAITEPHVLVATFGYLLLAPALRRSGLVDKRKGAYRQCMIAYNVLMAILSAVCFFATVTALGWDGGYGAWLRKLTGDTPVMLFTNQCPSPVFSSRLFLLAAHVFYWSKVVEFLDTAWLVLKGKSVSFLQARALFAHATRVYAEVGAELISGHQASPWIRCGATQRHASHVCCAGLSSLWSAVGHLPRPPATE